MGEPKPQAYRGPIIAESFACHKTGHKAGQCPDREKLGPFCYGCVETGFTKLCCPNCGEPYTSKLVLCGKWSQKPGQRIFRGGVELREQLEKIYQACKRNGRRARNYREEN